MTETYDAVINCTGLDPVAGLAGNPFLTSLLQGGWIRRDPCGLGFEVDARCRAVGSDGMARAMLRLVGPPTVGSVGDPHDGAGACYALYDADSRRVRWRRV